MLGRNWHAAIEAFLRSQAAAGLSPGTRQLREFHLRRLATEIGGGGGFMGPGDVTGADLVDWLSGKDWKAETRRSHRATFRAFFAWLEAAGVRDDNPALELPKVRPAAPNPRPLPAAYYRAGMIAADERTQWMLRLMGDAGMRCAEVAQVHSHDLVPDLVGWSLIVHGKGGKDRIVPVDDVLGARITAAGGFLFPGQAAGHLSAKWVGKLVSRVLPAGWTAHKLRHMFATDAHRAANGDVFIVQQLLGHASPATTQLYVALPDDARRATVKAVLARRRAA